MVARYAGKPELVSKVKDAVRAQQATSDVISLSAAFAQILERVVLGCSVLVRPLPPVQVQPLCLHLATLFEIQQQVSLCMSQTGSVISTWQSMKNNTAMRQCHVSKHL